MKGTETGLFCTVEEAGRVLGMSIFEIRKQMREGTLKIGELIRRDKRTTYIIRKDLVAKAAGLDEFPSDVVVGPKVEMAMKAGTRLKKAGIDAAAVADVLLDEGMITPYQHKKMAGVME